MNYGRTIIWLLIGIAAAAGAHVAIDVKTHQTPHALRRRSLEKRAEKAKRFTLERANEPAIQLVHESGWKVVSPFVAEAEESVILRLSDALAFAPIADEMTDAELLRIGRTREDFGLDKPRLIVNVTAEKEGLSTPIRFGLPTPAGDNVYATIGADDTVFLVSSNVFAAVNLPAKSFRRRRLATVNPKNVTSFDIKNGTERFVRIVRSGETWKVAEPHESVASASHVDEFIRTLCRLEARDFIWPVGASNEATVATASVLAGYGLDTESAVSITLKCDNGNVCTVAFGRETDGGLAYAFMPGGSAIVTVPSAVRTLARGGMNAFIDARLFPFTIESINALSLIDGHTTYLLSRNRTDGKWRLDAPVSAMADETAVKTLIGRMLETKERDIDENGIRISTDTNATPISISRNALLANTHLEDLRAKEILTLDPKLIKRIVTTDQGSKPTSITFDAEKSAWMTESANGLMANGKAINHLTAVLSPLRAIRIVKLKITAPELGQFGLDKPARTIAIDQTGEGLMRRNILIGDVTDGGRFATIGASDAVFVISSETAASLLAPIAQ